MVFTGSEEMLILRGVKVCGKGLKIKSFRLIPEKEKEERRKQIKCYSMEAACYVVQR